MIEKLLLQIPDYIKLLLLLLPLVAQIILTIINKKSSVSKKDTKLLIGLSNKYFTNIKLTQDSILRDQMNYTENKLENLMYYLIDEYKSFIKKNIEKFVSEGKFFNILDSCKKLNEPSVCKSDEIKRVFLKDLCTFYEYINIKVYSDILNKSCNEMIKKFRLSFKENNIDLLSDIEFKDYVKEKHSNIVTSAVLKLRENFDESILVSHLGNYIDFITDNRRVEDDIHDIFQQALFITKKAKAKIIEITENYEKEVDNLILSQKDK